MTILIVGASGATGSLLIQQLLNNDQEVRIIVRSINKLKTILPIKVIQDSRLTITEASILDMSFIELQKQIIGCHAVISCLGHNLTFKGMFAQPRRLVSQTIQRLCHAIEITKTVEKIPPIKFILMNTTGNQNKADGETVSLTQTIVVAMLRLFLPPHADNEMAAQFLQKEIADNNPFIEWVVVRPDSLTNQQAVTEYEIFTAPIRSAIFDAGKTSRVNVAHFMAQLVSNDQVWNQWKSKMPTIYNCSM